MSVKQQDRGFSVKSDSVKTSIAMWMIIAVLIIFGARVWSLYEDAHTKYVQILMKSSVSSVAQIFYDIGQGFTEKNMSTVTIYKSEEFSEYRFPIPDKKKIFNLRFDPLATSGHVEIRQMRITDGLANTFWGFHLKQLVLSNQISRLDIINDHISVDIDRNADDPQIGIQIEKPFLLLPEVHPSYHGTLFLSFCIILLSVLLIYIWVKWNDGKNLKKWICYGLIAMGFFIVTFHCLQTCLNILNRSIQPLGGGDTEVYLYMAGLKWTDLYFYHGLRPPIVPILYSLVNGAENNHNIILLQTIISYMSWIFLAFMTARLLKDYLTKMFVFLIVALIPLNDFIHHWNLVILSESLSFSFLAIFLGIYLLYYKKQSVSSVVCLAIVALIFAFTRDTDAYRVLLMTLPILPLIAQRIRNKTGKVTRHVILLFVFIFIFIGSDLSSSNIYCRDCTTPYWNARWYMPTINNLFQRILPFADRVKYFEAHGMPVTPELMAMRHKWASSNNWQSSYDPKFEALREWNYRHGRQTYMKYLIDHPQYVLTSAFDYRDPLLYLDGSQNAWNYSKAKPINARILSVFFLNDDHDLKVFMVLFTFSLLVILIIYVRHAKDDVGDIKMILLVCYIILITIPLGILIFHGDLMDLRRHSFTNIIQLNFGVVLFYFFMADFLMMRMRMEAVKK
jgi:hypothetical protein